MNSTKRKKVIVVGGGPSGMFAAWYLAGECEVHLFEQSGSLGRKMLVAGKGGLNITNHSIKRIREAYLPEGFMDRALDVFDNVALQDWLHTIGVPTYTGSSGKVFPQRGIKAIEVVQKIIKALYDRNVIIHLNHKLISFTADNNFIFELTTTTEQADIEASHKIVNSNEKQTSFVEQAQPIVNPGKATYACDYSILALGGASWPQTGSNGLWVNIFRENAIDTLPFQPSNCGIDIKWPDSIKQFHTGKPLKNITISVLTEREGTLEPVSLSDETRPSITAKENIKLPARGEALITSYGLEGASIYRVIPLIRKCLSAETKTYISIDFKPSNSINQLLKKVSTLNTSIAGGASGTKNIPDYKNRLSLQTEQMALIKAYTHKDTLANNAQFCMALKNLIIPVHSLRPIDEAISVVGGVSLNDINENLSLKANPTIFVTGEMVNWDAPTGGFLLQGCFSMAALAAQSIIKA